MITINKALLGSAAMVAVGLIAVVDMAQSRSDLTAAAAVAARFPAASEMMVTLTPGAMPSEGCTREHWPYIADECLTRAGGTEVKRPTRTIAIERRAPEPAQVASR